MVETNFNTMQQSAWGGGGGGGREAVEHVSFAGPCWPLQLLLISLHLGLGGTSEQQRHRCAVILYYILFQGLLNASLDCEEAAEAVNDVLTTCQTKCPIVLLSAVVSVHVFFHA